MSGANGASMAKKFAALTFRKLKAIVPSNERQPVNREIRNFRESSKLRQYSPEGRTIPHGSITDKLLQMRITLIPIRV